MAGVKGCLGIMGRWETNYLNVSGSKITMNIINAKINKSTINKITVSVLTTTI